MKVCIIGAGAAGLCAAHHCLIKNWKVIIFEKTDQIGGTWVYVENSSEKKGSVHSSMYKSLKTNLPKEVMNFPDFPFPDHSPSFVSHELVRQYLLDYAFNYDITSHIKFNHMVVSVEPLQHVANYYLWKVTTKSSTDNKEKSFTLFDAVFVCNGHFSKPYIPVIDGQSNFKGEQMHSHDYKEPSPFFTKRVACLGAGPSGVDIAIDIASCANCVYLCHRKTPYMSQFPENLFQKPSICGFTKNSIILTNGELIEVDVVIYCTGYCYSFEFLNQDFMQVSNNHVSPLYLHLVHSDYPTIFFIGICNLIIPFTHFDVQMRYAVSVLTGLTKLPSKADMEKWIRNDIEYRRKNVPSKQMHFLGPRLWDYLKELATLGNFSISDIPPVLNEIFHFCHRYRVQNFLTYRQCNFKIIDDNTFVYF